MGFDPYKTPIDIVIMRGVPTPGIARVEKAKREIKIDEIGGFGVSGSVIVVHGKKLVPFDVVITLLTSEHWLEWENFKRIVLTMPTGPEAKAIDIWHPWLQMLEVKSCVVNAVSQPEEDETGGFEIRISCTEFRKPKPALASPEAASEKPEEERDPYMQKIDDLVNQVDRLTLRDKYTDVSPYAGRN